LERVLALYDPEQHRSLAFSYVQDPRVAALSGLSWALLALGYPEQAKARSREALDAARELSHQNTLAYALLFACMFEQIRRVRRDAQDRAEELIALATEQNFPHFLAVATIVRGWALSEAGEVDAGLAHLQQGIPAWYATGAGLYEPYFLGLQAEAHGRAGSVDQGLDVIAQALRRVEETGERWLEAELHRQAGELMLQQRGTDLTGAEARFRQAMMIARFQNAKLWELRAVTSLARVWSDNGKHEEARDLLAGVYGWFVEGSDTPDLKQAKALLDELARASPKRAEFENRP
jgi:predicted ATPase